MFKEFNSLHDFDGVTETQCVEHYRDLRWPNGPICPHCGNTDANRIGALKGKAHRPGLFQCAECREQFFSIAAAT